MSEPVKVQWPAKALNSTGDDLAPALRSLLEELRLLETRSDEEKGVGAMRTPQSLQVLTAGSTTITKLYTSLATVFGGGGAILAGIAAFWKNLVGSPTDQAIQRSALMIAAAILGAAVVIAVSIMVRGDVAARAEAAAAAYASRAAVAASFLKTVEAALPTPPAVTPYAVLTAGKSWITVDAFEWKDGNVVAVSQSDRIPATEWRGLIRLTELGVA